MRPAPEKRPDEPPLFQIQVNQRVQAYRCKEKCGPPHIAEGRNTASLTASATGRSCRRSLPSLGQRFSRLTSKRPRPRASGRSRSGHRSGGRGRCGGGLRRRRGLRARTLDGSGRTEIGVSNGLVEGRHGRLRRRKS